jgi:hypothetical protein
MNGAGPFDIQRVPLGLQNVLNLFGSGTPPRLAPEIVGVLDLLQFYGLNQRQVLFANNAAVAEGASLSISTPLTNWSVLYALTGAFTKTATLTALCGTLQIARPGAAAAGYASSEWQRFGATDTGTVGFHFVPSYCLLCPPGTTFSVIPQIIGTDATINTVVQAEIGLFG